MNLAPYKHLLSTDISDALPVGYAMEFAIASVYSPPPRLMGFAYTVRCENRSNTYLHDAIYKAPKDAVIVAETDGNDYAVAGGNVCAVAKANGVAGFVVDGAVRDLGEIRELGFPVYARGVFPKPGGKTDAGASKVEVVCGGVKVNTGDLIVADEEGIAVVPASSVEVVLADALEKQQQNEAQSLDDWRAKHHTKILDVLKNK